MTDIGVRIKARKEELGLLQVELARLVGVKPPSVSAWESGDTRSLKAHTLMALSRVLRVTPEWLMYGTNPLGFIEGEWREVEALAPPRSGISERALPYIAQPIEEIVGRDSDYVGVAKVNGAHLSAGNGATAWEYDRVDDSHLFRRDWMQTKRLNPAHCVIWSVRGESMEPRFMAGDVVLIDELDQEPIHGKVYALTGPDGMRIKQLRRSPVGWEMHSLNPDKDRYPPEPIIDSNYRVIGRVRWRAGEEI